MERKYKGLIALCVVIVVILFVIIMVQLDSNDNLLKSYKPRDDLYRQVRTYDDAYQSSLLAMGGASKQFNDAIAAYNSQLQQRESEGWFPSTPTPSTKELLAVLTPAVQEFSSQYELFVATADEYYRFIDLHESELSVVMTNPSQTKIDIQQSKVVARQNLEYMRSVLQQLSERQTAQQDAFNKLLGLLVGVL